MQSLDIAVSDSAYTTRSRVSALASFAPDFRAFFRRQNKAPPSAELCQVWWRRGGEGRGGGEGAEPAVAARRRLTPGSEQCARGGAAGEVVRVFTARIRVRFFSRRTISGDFPGAALAEVIQQVGPSGT